MTIQQAFTKGLKFVKKRGWRDGNYAELPPMVDGLHGPWAKIGIHNPDGVIAPVKYGLETNVLVPHLDDGEDDWEPIDIPLRRFEET